MIIAEIGINHNGDIDIAKQLIDMAVRCGCDAVKFQKRTIEKVYTKEFLDSPRESPWGTTQREQKEGLEFNEEYDEINEYCKGKIDWFASAWDVDSQLFLRRYDLKYNKIASKMLANQDLVDAVAEEGKQTFVSTGLSDMDLIDYAVGEIGGITLMHCVMKYPCPAEECNLSRIQYLKEQYVCPVGYSSHHPSLIDKRIAIALGVEAIEVHISLDRSLYGSDQSASIEERGLSLLVRDAKRIPTML